MNVERSRLLTIVDIAAFGDACNRRTCRMTHAVLRETATFRIFAKRRTSTCRQLSPRRFVNCRHASFRQLSTCVVSLVGEARPVVSHSAIFLFIHWPSQSGFTTMPIPIQATIHTPIGISGRAFTDPLVRCPSPQAGREGWNRERRVQRRCRCCY